MTPRTLKFIGCEILYREACALAARCPHRVDLQFLRKGLHDMKHADMLATIQSAVDQAGDGYEAVLLGYARCNDGVAGLTARRTPLVVPRAHDCITFFFGSRAAYRAYFDEHPGTYYRTTGWSERSAGQADDPDAVMTQLGLNRSHAELVAAYGQENADFIAQVLGNWATNYDRLCYIEMGVCDERPFIAAARAEAAGRSWGFDLRQGDWTLLEKLFLGPWDDDFVVLPPGWRLVARNDANILDAAPPDVLGGRSGPPGADTAF